MANKEIRPPDPGEARELDRKIKVAGAKLSDKLAKATQEERIARECYKQLAESRQRIREGLFPEGRENLVIISGAVLKGIKGLLEGLPVLAEKVREYAVVREEYEKARSEDWSNRVRRGNLETWAEQEGKRILYEENI